jgi:3-hydroxyisobutyrate dehydrogenase
MVNDDAASREVWLGERGVLSGDVRPGTFAIECSTLSHKWTMQLADAARAHRLRYLDAPVTGLPDDASAGTLTLFIGARQKDLDDASPLLQAVAQDWIHFGQVGAGTAYKLIVNLVGAVQIGAVAESMAIAERAGLDLDLVAEAISRGQAASPQVVRNSRRMAAGEHDAVVFTGALRRKDAAYGVELAEQLGLGVRFGDAALAGLDGLVAAGLGDKNESSIIEIARRIPARNPAMPS